MIALVSTTTRDFNIREINKPVSIKLLSVPVMGKSYYGKNVFSLREYVTNKVLSEVKSSPDTFQMIDETLEGYERFVRYDNNGEIPRFAKNLVEKAIRNIKKKSIKPKTNRPSHDTTVTYNGITYRLIRRK